ncbi:MAG: IS21 family transposase [Thermoleophilia bacterium]|nr:IS21 family transposase [Thermoleophilia bacterium]
MLDVEKWAELRRRHLVDGVSLKRLARETGLSRNTVRKAIRADSPPTYTRPKRPSKLDPFLEQISELLKDDTKIPSQVIGNRITEAGYTGRQTILDDLVRELRPVHAPSRRFQRTTYLPGEICQFDIWRPGEEIPVGHAETREGYVVVCCLGYSRAGAGALVFSKTATDLTWGMARCLKKLGALPKTLVWDREGSLHGGEGRPSAEFAAFCGSVGVGWHFCEAADPQAKGVVERLQGYIETSYEPARIYANHLDYQDQLDNWFDSKANARIHRELREVPAERLIIEHESMRPLPESLFPDPKSWVIRVPAQPFFRFDTNDYSLDPRFAGRRVEVKASQRELVARVLDTGEIAAHHRRRFARHLTLTDPLHEKLLRKRELREPEVEIRPLDRYDALIPR